MILNFKPYMGKYFKILINVIAILRRLAGKEHDHAEDDCESADGSNDSTPFSWRNFADEHEKTNRPDRS